MSEQKTTAAAASESGDVPVLPSPVQSICDELIAARRHGQQKYGGNDPVGHDLNHRLSEWLGFIRDHLDRAGSEDAGRSLEQREHLVKAGGLILSAIWAEDANAGRTPLPGANAPTVLVPAAAAASESGDADKIVMPLPTAMPVRRFVDESKKAAASESGDATALTSYEVSIIARAQGGRDINAGEALRLFDRIQSLRTLATAQAGEIGALEAALKQCLDAMYMQEKRESEEFHIPQETALCIWRDAQRAGREAIARAAAQTEAP